MLVIRATQKLLPKLGSPVADPPASTTVLGDWYAKPVSVAQRRYVLLISEHSRLAVVMPGREVAKLPQRFPEAMGMQLALLEVPKEAYKREMAECAQVLIAKTASRSLLGTLNDYAYMLHHRLSTRADDDLDAAAFSLSHTPLAPLGYKYASEVALSLFGIESKRSPWPF